MKLVIYDGGDPSVGIFPIAWEMDVPFERNDVDNEILNEFRDEVIKLYQEYGDCKPTASYDFEIEEESKEIYKNLLIDDDRFKDL